MSRGVPWKSDEQMAAMATDRQIIVSGTSQLGDGNKQYRNSTDNSTSNNVVYNNCNFFYVEKYAPNGNQSQQVPPSFRIEESQQLPRLSNIPPAGRLAEQCLQHMHNHIQAQSSWTGSRCPLCGSPTLPGHSPPTPSQPVDTCQPACQRKKNNQVTYKKGPSKMIKRTNKQSERQLPSCSGSTDTNPATAVETEDIQTAPTATPEDILIFDSKGRVLQPGDGVEIGSVFSQVYDGIYVGNMQVVRCEEDTQKVIIENLDVSLPFNRWTPNSEGPCKIFSAEMRVDQARSCVGKVSPVSETWCGADFVIWTFTGLNWRQAMDEGFRLW